MLRRVVFHNVKTPFILNLNLNIQNNQFNNNNYIHNNYNSQKSVIDIKQIQQNEQKHVQQTGKLIDDYQFNEQE